MAAIADPPYARECVGHRDRLQDRHASRISDATEWWQVVEDGVPQHDCVAVNKVAETRPVSRADVKHESGDAAMSVRGIENASEAKLVRSPNLVLRRYRGWREGNATTAAIRCARGSTRDDWACGENCNRRGKTHKRCQWLQNASRSTAGGALKGARKRAAAVALRGVQS